MAFKVLDAVVLVRDLTGRGLRSGDLGTIVELRPGSAVVEFLTASGRAHALVELDPDDLRDVEAEDVVAVRRMRAAG